MPALILDGTASPICPKCGNAIFRPGHMMKFVKESKDGIPDGSFCCCMWCSQIWQLSGTLDNVQFAPIAPELLSKVPELTRAADNFARNRVAAAMLGIPYLQFLEMNDVLFPHIKPDSRPH